MKLLLGSILTGGAMLLCASTAAAQPLAPASQWVPLAGPAPAPLAQAQLGHGNTGMMITGIVLTGVASAMLVAGSALLTSPNNAEASVFLLPMSVVPALVGIPLWVGGAASPRPEYRNNGMRSAGMALTVLGSILVVLGGLAAGTDAAAEQPGCHHGDIGCGVYPLIMGGTIGGTGAVLLATGIPLWVSGARPPGALAEIPAWAVPTVGGGAGSASLRWRF